MCRKTSPDIKDGKSHLLTDGKLGGPSPTVDKKCLSNPSHPECRKRMHGFSLKKFFDFEFKYIKLVQVLCGIYILTVTFTYTGELGVFGGARDRETGLIIDPNNYDNTVNGIMKFAKPVYSDGTVIIFSRAIVAATTTQMVLLGLSRFSGYFMYPAIICVFWTKLRATQAFIDKTPLSVFCIQDSHRLHVYCGWVILVDGCLHTTFHLLRWALQKNLYLLFSHPSGITGFIVIISTFIIVFPMTILRKRIKFEVRKYAHYLFWIWCIAMTFHAPKHAIPNGGFSAYVFPMLMIAYGLDSAYVKFFMSERINTVDYKVLNSGVQLTMPVSKRFQDSILSGGFGYIMFPWVNKKQWHAFSLYENPFKPSVRHVFIAKAGDWTSEVHRKIDMCTNTTRPVWITGPFPSPYNNAINFDNMILVASGIGITPALSAIEANRDSRRINLLWAVREASMLVFFLENAKLDEKGLNLIFYTGKEELPSTIANCHDNGQNAHVKIIKERPNLSYIIPNLIEFVDSSGNKWRKEKEPDVFEATNITKDTADEILSDDIGSSKVDAERENKSFFDLEVGNEESFSGTQSSSLSQPILDANIPPSKQDVDTDDDADWDFGFSETLEADEEWTRPLIPTSPTPASSGEKCSIIRTSTFNDLAGGVKDTWRASSMPEVWKENAKTDTRHYVKAVMEEEHLETWGMLFCGGRNKLLENLVRESKDLGIPLHEEAFDW